MSLDCLVMTRQGVFGLIILVLVCGVPCLTTFRQGARVPSTDILDTDGTLMVYAPISKQTEMRLALNATHSRCQALRVGPMQCYRVGWCVSCMSAGAVGGRTQENVARVRSGERIRRHLLQNVNVQLSREGASTILLGSKIILPRGRAEA